MRAAIAASLLALSISPPALAEPPLDGPGPYSTTSQTNVSIPLAGQTLVVDLFAPVGAPPAPIIVGAHGLDSYKEDIDGWGTHLASFGFAVAIPQFTGTDQTAAPANAASENALLDWMQAQGAVAGSFYAGLADGSRRGIFGHSMGGLVEFLAAGESPAIQVAVGFDPVDVNGMAAAAVPTMKAFPVVLRASIQSVCNAAAPAEAAVIAAFPGSSLVLTVANTMHCDPEDPESQACVLSCTPTVSPPYTCSANPAALAVFRRYATAAFLYVLMCDADARSNLDGTAAQADIADGTVTNFVATNIGPPGGCVAADAGVPSDAGLSPEPDAGALPVADAGSPEFADSGSPEFADAGSPGADAGGVDAGEQPERVPAGGCRCSGLDAGLAALAGLIALRTRKMAARP